jgi:hypothetical protein
VNTTAFHGLPNDDVPLREETLPIHDIKLTFRGYHIKSITQQPEGKTLELVEEGEVVSVVVPRIDVHSIVVAELAPPLQGPKQ